MKRMLSRQLREPGSLRGEGNLVKFGKLLLGFVAVFALSMLFGGLPVGSTEIHVSPPPLGAAIGRLQQTHRRQAHRRHHTAASTAGQTTVVTNQGPLKSNDSTTGAGYFPMNATEYLGIPYAAPPVGDLRWMPPQAPAPFKGVFEANGSLTRSCPQPDGAGGLIGDENCLFLNVYVPNISQPAHGFPVMVWIHGGSSTGSFFDPAPLVEKGGAIVITLNYRLGLLGFFAHPAIDAEGHLNGNYGFMDQQFALKWVQKNIGAFGGDRRRVTLFGQSAGGSSVYANLASPTAAGLFQRAIGESGASLEFQDYFNFIVPLAQGETEGTGLVPSGTSQAASAGCPSQTAQCLRAASALALVSAEPGTSFPFVDGTILTQTPTAALATGQFNRVPVISGGTHDEWRSFVAFQYDGTLTDAGYPAAVASLEGTTVDDPFIQFLVNVLYPLSNYPPPPGVPSGAPLALGALGTDEIFACPERNSVRSLSQYVTTYAYEFNDENAPPFALIPCPSCFPLGAYHFAEVLYLFDVGATFTPDQQLLSNTMIGYWTRFAATGDPNSAEAPVWSPYSSGTDQFQSLIPPNPMVEPSFSFDSDHKCSGFWSSF